MSTLTATRPTSISHKTRSISSTSFAASKPKKDMSITQTYYLAHKARGKLSREAAQPDHDLRLLVGHANLLDSLMLELAEAEREQERWFNQSVRGASTKNSAAQQQQQRHIQWADRIEEEAAEDYDESSDSSDSDSEFEYEEKTIRSTTKSATPQVHTVRELDSEMDDEDEEDFAQLELVRTYSHTASPPELLHDHDSESSDDESMPPSPTQTPLLLAEAPKSTEQELLEKEYYGSQRPGTALVSSVMVY